VRLHSSQRQTRPTEAGESGEIVFKLDLTNARGAVSKSITVPSNDPHNLR